jgi:hypothetical protein
VSERERERERERDAGTRVETAGAWLRCSNLNASHNWLSGDIPVADVWEIEQLCLEYDAAVFPTSVCVLRIVSLLLLLCVRLSWQCQCRRSARLWFRPLVEFVHRQRLSHRPAGGSVQHDSV